MKKLITLILVLIVAACSMSPAPTQEQLIEMGVIHPDTEYVDVKIISDDETMVIEIPISEDTTKPIEPDTTKRMSRKEEIKQIQKKYDEQQEDVLEQIERLEKQQTKLDSILEKKKKEGDN